MKDDWASALPLLVACENDHYEVVKLLLDEGADPNVNDRVSTLYTVIYDFLS